MEFYVVEFLILGLYLFLILRLEYRNANSPVLDSRSLYSTEKTYLRIIFIFLAILVMFRENSIGNDSIAYFRGFQRTSEFGDTRYETGFAVLLYLSKRISHYPYTIFITSGAIAMFLFYHLIEKYSKWFFMSVILFVFLDFFELNMNIMRQGLAMGVICLSYKYLLNKKLFKFITIVLIATLFHSSAIIFLISWFIYRLKLNFKNLAFSLCGLIVAYIMFDLVLANLFWGLDQYEDYRETIYGEGGRIGALFQASIYILLLIIVLIIRRKIGTKKFTEHHLDGLFYLCFAGAGFLLISFNMSVVGRIAFYFNIFQLILIPNILKLTTEKRRLNYVIVLILALNIYKWTILIMRPEWNIVYPYKIHLPF